MSQVSRSSVAFRRRSGLELPLKVTRPRFYSGGLIIHSLPLRRAQLNPGLMLDRGTADAFVPPQVADDGGPGRGDQR